MKEPSSRVLRTERCKAAAFEQVMLWLHEGYTVSKISADSPVYTIDGDKVVMRNLRIQRDINPQ